MVRIPFVGVAGGLPQRREKGPGAGASFGVSQMGGNPRVSGPAPAVRSHPPAGDVGKHLALPVFVRQCARHLECVLAVRAGGLPVAAQELPEEGAVRAVAQDVPQQAVQLPAGPAQVHPRRQDLRGVGEIGDPGFVDLVRAQKDFHPEPPIGPHVQRRLKQAADGAIHVFPIIRAAVQSVEKDQEMPVFPIEGRIAFVEQAVDRFRFGFHPRHAVPPAGLPSQRMVVGRQMPGQHRSPDGFRLRVPHQPREHVDARIVVRRRRGAETGAHFGILAQRRPRVRGADEAAHAGLPKRAPPEGLSRAAHPGHQRDVQVHRLQMGARQVDPLRVRSPAIAGFLGQTDQGLADHRRVDRRHRASPLLPIRPSKCGRNAP